MKSDYYVDCKPDVILVSVLSRMAQIFYGKSWIPLGQSHWGRKISEGIIKEIISSPGFNTWFVRSHSLALRPDALLCSTLAGSTGKAGPQKNSQLPCSSTLKKFMHSVLFISKVCELRFCLFFNQKSIRKATREVKTRECALSSCHKKRFASIVISPHRIRCLFTWKPNLISDMVSHAELPIPDSELTQKS